MTTMHNGQRQADTAAELLDFAYQAAVAMAEQRFTAPDDDWAPILLFRGSAGAMNIVGVPMIQDHKDQVAAAIAGLLSANKARSAAMLLSSWMIARPAEGTDVSDERPSEAPDRREVLVLLAVDDSSALSRVAAIQRHTGRPPTLGPAQELGDGPAQGGRFIDALRRGVG